MSKQLLERINGNRNGVFRKFLNDFKGDPRIAWYPSAGEDFRPLLYLHPSFAAYRPMDIEEPSAPDIFLFTDYFPWDDSSFLNSREILYDGLTRISVLEIEQLPDIRLPLDREIVKFTNGSIATHKVVFMRVLIDSHRLGRFSWPILYVFAENESFCGEVLLPLQARLSHIIHISYGGGFGDPDHQSRKDIFVRPWDEYVKEGGYASGIWLKNVIRPLRCEYFITSNNFKWQDGDKKAVQLYPALGVPDNELALTPLRTSGWLGSAMWYGTGLGIKRVSAISAEF